MKYLLDTHLVLWAASSSSKLSKRALTIITDLENELLFSAASIWEIAIKSSLERDDFKVDTSLFRRALLDNGYVELPISGEHAAMLTVLPPLHKDPFDRMLIAQAITEGMTLLTVDPAFAGYPGPILQV